MGVPWKAMLLISVLLFLPAAKADYIMPTNFDLNVFQNISTLNVSALPCAIGQIPIVDASGWVCGNTAGGNTSAEINAALNSSFFTLNRPWLGGLGWANLTAYPNACPAGEAVTTIGDTLVCTAFMTTTYNATYDAKPSNTYNSTYDAKPNNNYNATYDAKPSNTYNASYNAQLGHNTTDEIFAAVNNATFHRFNQLLNFSNITVCAENQIIKISGGAWACQADNAGSGGNTSAEMLAAINATGNGFFNLTSWFTLYVNNATERELFTRAYNASYMTDTYNVTYDSKPANTYNATYDAKPANTYNASYNDQLGHNTTAEIQAAQKTTGNTTNEIFAAVNNATFQTGSELWNTTADIQAAQKTTGNTTAEIRAAQTVNTTAEVRAAQTINSSAEVNAAMNSTFTGQLGKNTTAEIRTAIYSATMNLSNITTPADCAANNYVYGFTATGILQCRADQTGAAAAVNYWQTDGAYWLSVNESAGGFANLNISNLNATGWINATSIVTPSLVLGWVNLTDYPNACQAEQTITTIGDTITCAPFMTNTYNASYDAQLGHNTTAEINAALNSTFTGQLGKNTTAEIRTAVYSTTMNISNITSPTNCPDAQYVYGKNTYVWYCRADLFNTTVQIQAAQTVNTSAQVNAALNSSFFTLNRPWIGSLDAGNITGGTLKDSLLNGAVFQINGTTLLTAQNLTTGTINATHLTSNLGLGIGNLSVTQDFNMNQKNITYVMNTTYGSAAQAQIYWNGTHLIIAG